ncbi:hypothetical protein V5785_10880 [Bacillus subtilis]
MKKLIISTALLGFLFASLLNAGSYANESDSFQVAEKAINI